VQTSTFFEHPTARAPSHSDSTRLVPDGKASLAAKAQRQFDGLTWIEQRASDYRDLRSRQLVRLALVGGGCAAICSSVQAYNDLRGRIVSCR
jgi:hypothetical protein